MNIKEKISLDKLNFGIALLICFLLPLKPKLIPILITIWFLTFLIQQQKSFLKNIKNNKASLLLLSFFIIHLISLIYTHNLKSGLFDVETKLSFLIFPLAFPNLNIIYIEKFKKIIFSFILGCILASTICLLYGLYLYFIQNAPFQYLTYTELSLFLHPSYFSMYLCLAIAFLFHLMKEYNNSKKLLIIVSIFFSIMIFLLSSKSGLIALFFLLIINFFSIIKINFKTIIIGLFSFILLILVISENDRFQPLKSIIINTITNKSENNNKIESSSERIIIWEITSKLIRGNFLIGIGAGDVKDTLTNEYKKADFIIGEERNFNAHNQFLETFLSTGILGFLILIALFLVQTFNINKETKTVYFSFISIMLINFLVESILNTQAGIVFFTFFFCLFSLQTQKNTI